MPNLAGQGEGILSVNGQQVKLQTPYLDKAAIMKAIAASKRRYMKKTEAA